MKNEQVKNLRKARARRSRQLGHQTIKYLKDNPTINHNTIQGFGLQIGSTAKFTDIAHTGATPKYTELKSLLEGTGVDDGLDVLSGLNANPLKYRTQFVTQFKDGYLASINSLDELRYVFDARKLGADGETFIKNQFKDLFISKKEDIFEVIWNNQNLRESLFDLSNYPPNLNQTQLKQMMNTDFDILANNTQSKLYQFIKVE